MYNESIFESLFLERYNDFIPDIQIFLESLEKPLPVGLRLNKALCSMGKLIDRFELTEELYNIPLPELEYIEVGLDKKKWGGALEHHLGFYYIQALSSLIPVLSLSPFCESGEYILDMCAAPGGKTTFLAEQMNNKGVLVANEPHLGRRRILKSSLSRLGSSNVLVCAENGQNLNFPKESFSKILLDGPCSSEGTLRSNLISSSRKRDKTYLQYNQSFRKGLHRIQGQLLDKAYELLAPGGTLIYSTCTYDPLENEAQVSRLLNKYKDLSIEPLGISSNWDDLLCDGIQGYRNNEFIKNINFSKRVYPHKLNSIGFYVSKIVKSS